jgi:pyruvate carboxylase
MKMETAVKTKRAGVVKEILFAEGASIQQGDLLIVLE